VIAAALRRLDPRIGPVTVGAAQRDLAEQLEAEEARALQATVFRGRPGLDGIARFTGRLPNAQFAMFTKALEACASPRRTPTNPPGTRWRSGCTARRKSSTSTVTSLTPQWTLITMCPFATPWCRGRGCGNPRHHLTPWSHGGPTDLANGCLLCSFHHHLAPHPDWAIAMAADGVPELIPPARVDPNRRPIRHSRYKPRPG
jgi:hypothetical protein